jgi:hypothetical protein
MSTFLCLQVENRAFRLVSFYDTGLQLLGFCEKSFLALDSMKILDWGNPN